MDRTYRALMLGLAVILLWSGQLRADDATTPGELIFEPPTLICLGFEWRIEGDDNGNASARVEYREVGQPQWRSSLPLNRIGLGRKVNYGFGNFGDPNHAIRYTIPDALCGSMVDLQPGTEYEVQLTIEDPDGVKGEAQRTVRLSTRDEPKPFADGEVRHVYPPGHKGEKEQPAYRSIMHAVNGFHPWCDCYQTVHPNAAKPGTIVKVHGGTYKSDYNNYRGALTLWLSGSRTLIADGEPGKPIAIVAAGDGEVVIDAGGADVAFNIMAADHLYFEGLTIRNARVAFHAGIQGVMGATGLTVKHCWLDQVQYGVLAQDGRSENFYIADNVIIGRNPHDRFNPESGGAYGRTKGGYAVNLSGKGHVVAHNYTANMWDVINVFTSALADPALKQQARAIDIYNNDVINATDNFIEADGGYANIRVLRNRCFNVMGGPLSNQPVYAGPVYWIRNIVWNANGGKTAVKPDGSAQVFVFLHNTTSCHFRSPRVGQWDVRNNLFMGSAAIAGRHDDDRALGSYSGPAGDGHIVDHNVYRTGHPTTTPYRAGSETYASIEAFRQGAGYETHGLEVTDYALFADAAEPNHARSNRDRLVRPNEVDLRLARESVAIDRGAFIAGVNDDHTGRAPDIGAYEFGRPLPTYGPRSGPYLERLAELRNGTWSLDRPNDAGGVSSETAP